MKTNTQEGIDARFKTLIRVLGKTNNSFANSIGKTSTTINNIVEGKSKPGYEILEATFLTYPTVNRDWLLGGDGPVLKDSTPKEDPNQYLTDFLKRIEDQLTVKDRQIEYYQTQNQMLMSMLGKAEGVPLYGKFSAIAA